MLKFIHAKDHEEGSDLMAGRICDTLNAGKKVLWLVCGGSNIPISVEVMDSIRQTIAPDQLGSLTVAFTDERYGPVGHPDSNAKQLIDLGFKTEGISYIPILHGEPLEATARSYGVELNLEIAKIRKSGGVIIGQFGMGTDGHIAGIQPHTPAVVSTDPVCGYEWKPYTRVTITPPILLKIDVAYAFVFGESKREAVTNLETKDLLIDQEPAQILKQLPEAYLFSDLVAAS